MHEEHIPKAIPKHIKDLLLQALKKGDIDKIHLNFYEATLPHDFFQGNTFENVIFINLPNKKIGDHPVMVISNPCDTDMENDHKKAPKVTYCAVKDLSSFENALKQYSDMTDDEVEKYINNVKAQYVSDLFFLPGSGNNLTDRVAIFSQLTSCDMSYFKDNKPKVTSRLATKAYYLILTKLSIHFLRFGDLQPEK